MPQEEEMRLTADGKRYTDDSGVLYDRVSSLTKLAEYSQEGLLFAGATMVAKRVPEIVEAALKGEPYYRPTVVAGEPAVVGQDVSDWPGMVKWLSGSPSADLEKARNRGNLIDQLAVHFAEEGPMAVGDAGEWTVQRGIDMLMSFDQEEVRQRAHCFCSWWNYVRPTPIAWQVTVFDPDLCVCGTLDMITKIKDEPYLLDWKAGTYNPAYKMQVSSYRMFPGVYHEDPATAEAIGSVKSICTPALVCIGPDRVQFRPVTDAKKWYESLLNPLALYRGMTATEDCPVNNELSHTMTVWDRAEAEQ